MPGKDDLDFGSLFDDTSGTKDIVPKDDSASDQFTFDEIDIPEEIKKDTVKVTKELENISEENKKKIAEDSPKKILDEEIKKRSSRDFAPDMDSLLLTAQSPMVIEGMKCLTLRDFSSKTFSTYKEAVQGVDLYIKIIERNPGNFNKLSNLLNQDMDCREVAKIAFNLFKSKFNSMPITEDHQIEAFRLLSERLKNGYKKSLMSSSMLIIKKYFLLSGGLDEEKIRNYIRNGNFELKSDVEKLNQHAKLASEIMKSGDMEIAKGLKGKDVNVFIIRTTQLLYFYYLNNGNTQAAEYYKKMHNNYKKYQVVK